MAVVESESQTLSHMTKPLYILVKNYDPNIILLQEGDNIGFKALKESLMNPHVLRHPNNQVPFPPLCMKVKEMPLGYLPQNSETTINP